MEITVKSIHHSNIVFVFNREKFVFPENSDILSLYQGKAAAGATFADDVVLRTKILDLPNLKLQISVEPFRLRVDDSSQLEPSETSLIYEAAFIYSKLFSKIPLVGFGFNFDLYYQFREAILIKEIFKQFADKKILEKADLRHFGLQFTLEKEGGKRQETYFLKVTAPLEMAVHANFHFNTNELPILPPTLGQPDELTRERFLPLHNLFETYYNNIDNIIEFLRL